ncbi:MAG: tyrosine recombinase XerC [Atopobiaceae bacterium]|nr:tyrosine recombinase XerC [Atopobiaceae bacterium]
MSESDAGWWQLSEEFCAWLANVRNLSEHTVRAYRCDLDSFGDWCAAQGIDPLRATDRRLRGYLAHMVRSGYADKTINRHLSALRSMYRWLERRGKVASAAFASVPGRKQKKTLPRTMTDEDLARLLSVCDAETPEGKRDAALIETLYATGARISEVAGLVPADIDAAQGQIRLFGKGGKERVVPVYQQALVCLDDYLAHARPTLVARGKAGTRVEALFVSTRGNAMSADALRAQFSKLLAVAGLDARLSPHSVRHTYATELLNGGADLKTVQELLGHESLATTQIYTHLSVERLKEATKLAHPRA